MNVTTYDMGLEGLDALGQMDALCVFVPEDQRPLRGAAGFTDWRLCGALSRVLLDEGFVGSFNDRLLMPTNGMLGVPRIFAIGVGPAAQLTAERVSQILADAAQMLNRAKMGTVALEIPGAGVLEDERRAQALVQNFLPQFQGQRVAVLSDKAFGKLLPTG